MSGNGYVPSNDEFANAVGRINERAGRAIRKADFNVYASYMDNWFILRGMLSNADCLVFERNKIYRLIAQVQEYGKEGLKEYKEPKKRKGKLRKAVKGGKSRRHKSSTASLFDEPPPETF